MQSATAAGIGSERADTRLQIRYRKAKLRQKQRLQLKSQPAPGVDKPSNLVGYTLIAVDNLRPLGELESTKVVQGRPCRRKGIGLMPETAKSNPHVAEK